MKLRVIILLAILAGCIGYGLMDVLLPRPGYSQVSYAADQAGRLKIVGALTDGNGATLGVLMVGGNDGAGVRFFRTPSIVNFPTSVTLTARNSIGAIQAEKGSRWSVFSLPAVSNQASASIAAEAGVRHVLDCVSFAATEGGTVVTNTDLSVGVRDGASGAGTVLWVWAVSDQTPTATINTQYVSPHSICGLNLVGTTNTAMTVEFSALLTNLNESVSMSGYNVN